ncbi:hypothetical protein CEUSTIGMA_g2692.t1 [Chlamydomonas eustigma]|uniref:RAP domain-containing protein n=1 Tax=Chlamydomonas eustigma TaxID=1157962 RepID=A0A250WWN5_9CHLO|nr:hypothetical protein CEUSTIGMA_g2692.t1 [Chlamydomonas eustigma]|eukprot:GAX75247.1 hypothetical protein CEUSTIGMA_g2692.t1 [Chlamydomonas eustigma]
MREYQEWGGVNWKKRKEELGGHSITRAAAAANLLKSLEALIAVVQQDSSTGHLHLASHHAASLSAAIQRLCLAIATDGLVSLQGPRHHDVSSPITVVAQHAAHTAVTAPNELLVHTSSTAARCVGGDASSTQTEPRQEPPTSPSMPRQEPPASPSMRRQEPPTSPSMSFLHDQINQPADGAFGDEVAGILHSVASVCTAVLQSVSLTQPDSKKQYKRQHDKPWMSSSRQQPADSINQHSQASPCSSESSGWSRSTSSKQQYKSRPLDPSQGSGVGSLIYEVTSCISPPVKAMSSAEGHGGAAAAQQSISGGCPEGLGAGNGSSSSPGSGSSSSKDSDVVVGTSCSSSSPLLSTLSPRCLAQLIRALVLLRPHPYYVSPGAWRRLAEAAAAAAPRMDINTDVVHLTWAAVKQAELLSSHEEGSNGSGRYNYVWRGQQSTASHGIEGDPYKSTSTSPNNGALKACRSGHCQQEPGATTRLQNGEASGGWQRCGNQVRTWPLEVALGMRVAAAGPEEVAAAGVAAVASLAGGLPKLGKSVPREAYVSLAQGLKYRGPGCTSTAAAFFTTAHYHSHRPSSSSYIPSKLLSSYASMHTPASNMMTTEQHYDAGLVKPPQQKPQLHEGNKEVPNNANLLISCAPLDESRKPSRPSLMAHSSADYYPSMSQAGTGLMVPQALKEDHIDVNQTHSIEKAEAPKEVRQPLIFHMDPKQLARCLSGFASAGHHDVRLFDLAAVQAKRLMPCFGAVELSTLLWAFSKAGHCPRAFMVKTLKRQQKAQMPAGCQQAGQQQQQHPEASKGNYRDPEVEQQQDLWSQDVVPDAAMDLSNYGAFSSSTASAATEDEMLSSSTASAGTEDEMLSSSTASAATEDDEMHNQICRSPSSPSSPSLSSLHALLNDGIRKGATSSAKDDDDDDDTTTSEEGCQEGHTTFEVARDKLNAARGISVGSDPLFLHQESGSFVTALPSGGSGAVLRMLRSNARRLFAAASLHFVDTIGIHNLTDDQLVQLLYVYGGLRHHSVKLLEAAREEVQARLPHLSPRHLYLLAWSFEKVKFYDESLYKALVSAALYRLHDFPLRTLSGFLWALAVARHYDERLYRQAAGVVTDLLKPPNASVGVSTQINLKGMTGGSHQASLASEPALRSHHHSYHHQRASPHDITCIAMAFAQFNHHDEALFQALSAAAVRLLPSMNSWHVSNLTWSLSVVQHFNEKLFAAAFDKIAKEADRHQKAASAAALKASSGSSVVVAAVNKHVVSTQAAMQLYQAWLLLGDIYGGIIDTPAYIPTSLLRSCESLWKQTLMTGITTSDFQIAVGKALLRMGLRPKYEVLTEDGLFSIDIAVKWKGRRLAVEVDGGWHFSRSSTPRVPLARAVSKWRCLEMRGWKVVSVPWFQWFTLEDSDEVRQTYLEDLMDGVLWRTHQSSLYTT